MNSFTFVIVFLSIFSLACGAQDSTRNEILVLEQEPSFPGGERALKQFVNKNLRYPKKGCVEGTAFVSFIVNKDGSLTEIKIVKGICEECDKNAIEVFKKMPRWIPVERNVRMIYPVKFEL